MSSKTLRKQLLAAVAMVIVAAIAVTSSTFAWFAANTAVTATGMTVSAQSDAVFLEIKADATNAATNNPNGVGTISTSDATFSTTGTMSMTNVKLLPTAHGATAGTPSAFAATANLATIKAATAGASDSWYYRYNGNTDNATNAMTAPEAVPSANYGKYIAQLEYQVQLHEDNSQTAYDLYVSSITLPNKTGIRAIVVGADRNQEFAAANTADPAGTPVTTTFTGSPSEDRVALSDTVTHTTQTVTVLLYIDGDFAEVYTDNIAALTGAVTVNFGCFTTDTLS